MTFSGSDGKTLRLFSFILSAGTLSAQTIRNLPPNLDPSFWGKPNRPYVATIVQMTENTDSHGAKQEHTSHSKYYRDEAGRERSEGFYDSGLLSGAMLRDPSTTKVVMLHVVQRGADVLFVPHPVPPPPGQGWSVQELPPKIVLGIHVRGERFTRELSAQPGEKMGVITITEDAWFSEDLGLLMEEIYTDPRTGTIKKKITEIERTDPDPGLFSVPNGYTIRDFTGSAQ